MIEVQKRLKIMMKFQIYAKVQRMRQTMNLKMQQKKFNVLMKLYYEKLNWDKKLKKIVL